jgi:glucosylceramidase
MSAARRRTAVIATLAGVVVIAATAATPATAPARVKPGAAVVLTTSDLSSRLARLADLRASARPLHGATLIHAKTGVRYQRVSGFGAGMTDTSAWLLWEHVPPASRGALFQSLFGASGIHLSALHVPIGASDFTADKAPYTYDELPKGQTDPTLAHFSIAHDLPYIIPALRAALAANPRLSILAAPWTAPSWMKGNGRFDNLNHTGTLLPSSYGPFARYFVKFLQAYQHYGLRVDGVTVENEPGIPVPYPAMELQEPDEARFIANNLGPTLRAARLHTRIYGYDASWSGFPWPLVASPAGSYLGGVAWHCYVNDPSFMTRFHARAPALDQTVDECTPSRRPVPVSELVISSLRNWVNSMSLWNVALDPRGGPVAVHGGCAGCFGLVTIDEQSQTVSYGLSYYQLGQVSKFVQRGAVRISSENFVRYVYKKDANLASPGLDDVAFVNPDGSKVLIAYNNDAATIRFAVQTDQGYYSYRLAPRATVTLVWDRRA